MEVGTNCSKNMVHCSKNIEVEKNCRKSKGRTPSAGRTWATAVTGKKWRPIAAKTWSCYSTTERVR